MKKFIKAFAVITALIAVPVVADAHGGGGGFGGGGHMGGFGGFHGGGVGGFHAGEIGHYDGYHPGGFVHDHYGPGLRGGVLIDPAVPCYPAPYYYDPTYGAYCG
jgi:hypothetical protein